MYNQHFKRANIEAAVRAAITNTDKKIYINGKRSRNRYYTYYSKSKNTLFIKNETKKKLVGSVNIEELTKKQYKKDNAVFIIVEHFEDCIKEAA